MMNLRFTPSSIQTVNNTTNRNTAFLWFASEEIDVGVVITKKDLNKIRKCLNEVEAVINSDKEFHGNIEVIK